HRRVVFFASGMPSSGRRMKTRQGFRDQVQPSVRSFKSNVPDRVSFLHSTRFLFFLFFLPKSVYSCPVLAYARSYQLMATLMEHNSSGTVGLIERAGRGDAAALKELFTRHPDGLGRMVQMRLDWRLHGRIAASDVIQDAYRAAARRLDEYLRDPAMPL